MHKIWYLGSWLTCVAHCGSSKRSWVQTQLSARWNSTNPWPMSLIWEGCQWLVRLDLRLSFKKQKTKYATYIQGFPRPPNTYKCTPYMSTQEPILLHSCGNSKIRKHILYLTWLKSTKHSHPFHQLEVMCYFIT